MMLEMIAQVPVEATTIYVALTVGEENYHEPWRQLRSGGLANVSLIHN